MVCRVVAAANVWSRVLFFWLLFSVFLSAPVGCQRTYSLTVMSFTLFSELYARLSGPPLLGEDVVSGDVCVVLLRMRLLFASSM